MEHNEGKSKKDISLDPIPKKEELELIERFQSLQPGPLKSTLGSKIIRCNLRFLRMHASRYAKSYSLDEEDLHAQGKLEMWKALHSFDTSKDVKFISYAVWYIRKAFEEVLRSNTLIQHYHNKRSTKDNKFKDFENPLNFKYDSFDKVLYESEGEETTLEDTLSDDTSITDEETVLDSKKQKIKTALSMIPERESMVLSWYFGLSGNSMTHTEISEMMGVSKERSRQIWNRGLKLFKKALTQLDPNSKDYLTP